MNIGLFGGTFDPVHRGHLALARAALEQCKLHRIHFVPANIPPHKQRQPLSPFIHRFAMLALATAPEKAFVPSLLEAPEVVAPPVRTSPGRSSPIRSSKDPLEKPNYTIDTVRRLKQSFKAADKLFLLIGMDAFADIAKWHQSEALFGECEFVVASRPGYSLAGVTIHLLADLHQPASATAIRETAAAAKPLGRFVDADVAEYIRKVGLYK
jgi:nicotinate-nucleotide adenylyltransferase